MTIFITGGSGFVGRAVRRVAQEERGPEVVIIPRFDAVAFLRSRLAAGQRRATVMHLAWPSLRETFVSPHAAGAGWRDFLDLSVSLRVAAAEAGAWFVGIGSGVEACDPGPAASLGEPYGSYARQKTELMTALLRVAPSAMSWVRLHFMFGPFEHPSRIVPSAIGACLDGTEFACGRRDRRRRWLHVDDTAKLLLDFAAAPVGGVWDITGRQDLSFEELLGLVARAVGKPLRLSGNGSTNGDADLDVVAPTNLAPIVPEWAGRPESLLVRLRDYAHWIEAGRNAARSTLEVDGMGHGQRT
jgi:nucleoside-diphosphate-sugar epimerase